MPAHRHGAVLGVGIVGSGSVVQGIHVPTLARLPELFRISHVTDVDAPTARSVAERVGARSSVSMDELLGDPDVDVVAVCSPHPYHVEHVLAACESGVRAILCEKPLATDGDGARRIAEAARSSGTPVIVGSMHLFDPAWTFIQQHCHARAAETVSVRSNIVLPFNDRFEHWASEPIGSGPLPAVDHASPHGKASSISTQLLGLAIHDLPLVRAMTPAWRSVEVTAADVADPLGYRVHLAAENVLIELSGGFRGHWETEWEFEAVGHSYLAQADFSPSYVQAGSGTATVALPDATLSFPGSSRNGYECEWRTLAEAALDPEPHHARLDDYVADLDFALRIADQAARYLGREDS